MTVRRTALASATVAVAVATVGLLGACTQAGPEPVVTTVTPTEVVTPSPSSPAPEPTAGADGATIPTECTDVVDQATYDATFGSTPLNAPGVYVPGEVPAVPDGDEASNSAYRAGNKLYCVWRDPQADISGLSMQIATVADDVSAAYLAALPAKGYTCDDVDGGRECQQVSTHPQYQVELADTVFVRDGVTVSITQANVPTDDLMGAVVARIWG